jgi:Tfp pilus assembly PilM family ATPase
MQSTTTLQVRITAEMRDRLSRKVAALRAQHPGLQVSVASVAREALVRGLSEQERHDARDNAP